MDEEESRLTPFPSAEVDAGSAKRTVKTAQTLSPSYRLAYTDNDFLLRDELRPLRFQLELLKPELIQEEYGIKSTVVIFGSTRIPDPETAQDDLSRAEAAVAADPDNENKSRQVRIASRIRDKSKYYDAARELGRLISSETKPCEGYKSVVITGGGPGIMEAANRGAHDVDGKSIGLNIVLPKEQSPNIYTTPELSFQFHYFAIRKMHFLMRACALVAFPGGFGTLDELFETLTLLQTKKIKPVPVLLFGREFWQSVINFDTLVDEGTIDAEDLELFQYVETAQQAWDAIRSFER